MFYDFRTKNKKRQETGKEFGVLQDALLYISTFFKLSKYRFRKKIN